VFPLGSPHRNSKPQRSGLPGVVVISFHGMRSSWT